MKEIDSKRNLKKIETKKLATHTYMSKIIEITMERIMIKLKYFTFLFTLLLSFALIQLEYSQIIYGEDPFNAKSKKPGLNIVDFDALPNDGKDDTKALQRALKHSTNFTKILYFPAGTYDIQSQLDLTSNTLIEGENQNKTIILWHPNNSIQKTSNVNNGNLFKAKGEMNNHWINNITIRNLTIIGTQNGTSGDCIILDSVTNYIIENVKLIGCGSDAKDAAIRTQNTSNGKIIYNIINKAKNGYVSPLTEGSRNVDIAYNVITNSTFNGIYIANSSFNKIMHNKIIDSGDDNVKILLTNNALIQNNSITMNKNSTFVSAFEIGDGSYNIILDGNKVSGGVDYGINIINVNSKLSHKTNTNITIVKNDIKQTFIGCIRIDFSEFIMVSNNRFQECNINTKGQSSGIFLDKFSNGISIKNNIIEYYGRSYSTGIFIDEAHFIEILNNILTTKTIKGSYGIAIRITPLSDNILIKANDLRQCGCIIKNESTQSDVRIQQN